MYVNLLFSTRMRDVHIVDHFFRIPASTTRLMINVVNICHTPRL